MNPDARARSHMATEAVLSDTAVVAYDPDEQVIHLLDGELHRTVCGKELHKNAVKGISLRWAGDVVGRGDNLECEGCTLGKESDNSLRGGRR